MLVAIAVALPYPQDAPAGAAPPADAPPADGEQVDARFRHHHHHGGILLNQILTFGAHLNI